MIDLWRDEFDYVIIDSPPVLAVSDSPIIARVSDAVLFITRIVKNGRKVVERAKSVMDNQQINVLGVVVNGHSSRSNNYGYSKGYDKNIYGYGYAEENSDYYNNARRACPAPAGVEKVSVETEDVTV